MKAIIRLTVALMMAVLMMTACGSSVDVAARDRFVDAEAQRLCDIQRQTYPSQDELNKAFEAGLDRAGLTPKDRTKLLGQREHSKKLRNEIANKFAAICK